VANQDPQGPPPVEEDEPERCATLADVRQMIASTAWPWPGWLAAAVLNALASDPGIGKTIFAVTLACTLWFKRPWPDKQENPFPEKTKTLWVPGDRHYTQLLDLAAQYDLPDEALLLNAPQSDPTGGLDLDDSVYLESLAAWIKAEAPGLVIIDTVGMTTARNLCRPEDARSYFQPLMAIAQETGVPFLLLTHLSKDDQPLGRRIVGACRVVWKLTTPDPEGKPDQRRLWVDKSYIAKPEALGITISDSGCTFDENPPEKPDSRKGGRPSVKRDKTREFIKDALTKQNDQIGNDLQTRSGVSRTTFWRAVEGMEADDELTTEYGPGTGQQTVLHLVDNTQDTKDSGDVQN
jgi:hypothetical protein